MPEAGGDGGTAVSIEPPDGIETPNVVIDLERLESNITKWATWLPERGIGLRPHTKTSKCLPIVERQVAAGVVGLTVATLGEAEVLADAGFDHLFQAYPVWAGHPGRAHRLRALHDRVDLMVGVESADGAAALGRAVAGAGRALRVLIELDPGMHRTGVEPHDVVAIARACADAGLEVCGAFTFGGHGYHACDAPAQAADDEVRVLAAAAEELRSAGFDPAVLSAGSTPTAAGSARPPVTDERPGVYVFHDRQQVGLGVARWDEVALTVATTVVASHADGRFVLDAGSKVLSSDRPAWLEGHGFLPAHPSAVVRSLSEHHAVVWTDGPRPRVGDVLALVPNHCCAVVNLVDELVVAQRGAVVDTWPVSARGRNR
jgi:D-serine deaminase-like pyridoxal phosphate-dependent protein